MLTPTIPLGRFSDRQGRGGRVFSGTNAADLRGDRARVGAWKRGRKQLHRLRREPSRTLDGVDVRIFANAESRDDVAEAHALGAAGIGLYRTAFLFMDAVLPDEESPFRAYRDFALGITARPVPIRPLAPRPATAARPRHPPPPH